MTNTRPIGGRGAGAFPTIPDGMQIASFATYPEAQQAVDVLVRADFPVAQVSIIGTELTSVERVTGKMSWGRAAGGGVLSGLWFGMFAGLLFFIFAPTAGVGLLLSAALIGAGFGMVFSLVSYSITRRRRDFTSVMQVVAGRYGILVPAELAGRAREALGGLGRQPVPSSVPAPPEPTGAPVPPVASFGASADVAPSGAPEAAGAAAANAPAPMTYGEALDAARKREREERAASAAAARESAPSA
ncbi:general stress protein, partial [Agromyces seonyuensis]